MILKVPFVYQLPKLSEVKAPWARRAVPQVYLIGGVFLGCQVDSSPSVM